MLFFDRPDGRRVRGRPAIHAIMPYMMRGRNESAAYFEKNLDVENALRLIRERNAGLAADSPRGDDLPSSADRYSLFAYLLAACVRTFALRPELNRFIHGRALYQRNHIAISFIVKQRLAEDAPEASAKVFFEPGDSLGEVTGKVNAAIASIRKNGEGARGERLARAAHGIPGAKALVTGAYRVLDRFNLAPRSLIDSDPLYASAYFANLGSIGLESPYHHLYEWGNASFFIVMGTLSQSEGKQAAQGHRRHHIDVKVSVDERISDGLYFARSASVFSRLVSKPELLEMPLGEARQALEGARADS